MARTKFHSPIDLLMQQRFAILVLVLIVLFVVVSNREGSAESQPAVAAATADDGWRYTSQGWQHVSTWQSLDVDHDSIEETNGHTPLSLQVAGAMLIVGGFLGLCWLLTLEIDPIELRAFRLHRQRHGTSAKSA